jgi:AcrR family transcriptional regulator
MSLRTATIPGVSSSALRSQRREQREQTRREILATADRFLREHPFRELSVDVVMTQTGLTRTAFYRHFEDLTALVMQLLGDVGSELYEIGTGWVAGLRGDLEQSTHESLRGIVGFFQRHGSLVRAVADAASTDEEIERGYRGFLEAFIEMTVGGLDDLVERGRLEPCDTRELARALTLLNERYLLDTFGRKPQGDPAAALATLEHIWLRTLRSATAPVSNSIAPEGDETSARQRAG